MKLWFAHCRACMEEWCAAIYDHEPADEELKKHFCDVEGVSVVEGELKDVMNRSLEKAIIKLMEQR